MFFGFSAPKVGGVHMKTFSKPSFTHFFQRMAPPRGGGVYQISLDVALTTCIHLYSKSTQGANLWTLTACFLDSRAPTIGGVLMRKFSKPSFTHFFQKMAPPGGGGLPDFTRRGTNYLHTPLLKKFPKSKSLDSMGMFFGFSAPKIGGVLMKTFSKPSFTHFFQNNGPRGGEFTRFHQTWH